MRLFFVLSILLNGLFLHAQNFSGTIKSDFDEIIPFANVLIKNAETPDLITQFTTSKQDGSFVIQLKADFENILMEVTKYGFETETLYFKRSALKENQVLDIRMEESFVALEEVSIRQAPKIEVKEDTVNYRASAFLDGSERKVEDLLRKLPGVEVDDQGKIKYKGKNVEKVLLEGDDLFDSNYTLGTKNMNVDIVDQVQAIENFTENALLRGIQDSDKVALNLKLKKNVIDVSGNAAFGYGIENRHQTDLNALAITRSLKNFSNLTYNNLGENNSPYDFFSFQASLEDQKYAGMKAPKLIHERIFSSGLESHRANINDNWFSSFSNIYKFSKRMSARVNLTYYQDELRFFGSDQSDFTFEDGTNLMTSQQENVVKKPELYDGNVKLTWHSSKSSLMELTSKWNVENIRTQSDLFTNDENDLLTSLQSESFFTYQELLFTQKLNEKNALQIKGVFSRNDLPQTFHLTPGLDFESGQILDNSQNRQSSDFSRNYWELNSTLLGAKNKNKFQVSATLKYAQNQLVSQLFQNEKSLKANYSNDLTFNLLESNLEGFYHLKFGKLSAKPTLIIKNYAWKREDFSHNDHANGNRFVLSPSLNLSYKLSDVTRLFSSYAYDETPLSENNLYSGFVLSSNRSLSKKRFSDDFHQRHQFTLGFGIHDMYNQFNLTAALNYTEQKNNLFAQTHVAQNLTTTEYFFLPEGNQSYGGSFGVEKYIPWLQTTFKLNGNYSRSDYKNIVNNSGVRNNQSDIYLLNLYGKTALSSPINFQNELKLMHMNAKSENVKGTFQNTQIVNAFKILVKPNRYWFGSVALDYFQPSTQNPNEHYFVDVMIRYFTPNQIWGFSLTGKNLTNNQFFEEVYVSDYAHSSSLQSLNRAYVLASLSFSF